MTMVEHKTDFAPDREPSNRIGCEEEINWSVNNATSNNIHHTKYQVKQTKQKVT